MSSTELHPSIDLVSLLRLAEFSPKQQEIGLREFRIRGIDIIIAELKKSLPKEEATALNRYLRMCPHITVLIEHILNDYPEAQPLIEGYLPKLHTKIQKAID